MDSNIENKTQYQAELFANRLRKKYKTLKKWARRNRISCYRLYYRDIPEIPVSLDIYEFLPEGISSTIEAARFTGEQKARIEANDHSVDTEIRERSYALLYLYERPYEKDDEEEKAWLEAMAEAASEVTGIDISHFVKKMRGHKSHQAKNDQAGIDESKLKTSIQYQKNDNSN